MLTNSLDSLNMSSWSCLVCFNPALTCLTFLTSFYWRNSGLSTHHENSLPIELSPQTSDYFVNLSINYVFVNFYLLASLFFFYRLRVFLCIVPLLNYAKIISHKLYSNIDWVEHQNHKVNTFILVLKIIIYFERRQVQYTHNLNFVWKIGKPLMEQK